MNPMKILMTGSSGMIGSALRKYFEAEGITITRLVRSLKVMKHIPRAVYWNPPYEMPDKASLENHDVFIHLAGAGIGDRRWTKKYRKILYESRVVSTEILTKIIENLENKPKVFISASAIGIYGDQPFNVTLNEESPLGTGFLANLCKEWEAAAAPIRDQGIRVIHARFGIVLSPQGGMLKKILPIFKLGLGGVIGSGNQAISWIALTEVSEIMKFLMAKEELEGAVNVVSPTPVTQEKFTHTLARVLHRPAFLPVPSFAVKWFLGEMAEELLLSGQAVIPAKLIRHGYRHKYENLERALVDLLSPS